MLRDIVAAVQAAYGQLDREYVFGDFAFKVENGRYRLTWRGEPARVESGRREEERAFEVTAERLRAAGMVAGYAPNTGVLYVMRRAAAEV